MSIRKCSQCHQNKKESEFYNGQGWKCKECIKANSREYKKINKEKKKATDREYYLRNKEKLKAYSHNYNKENKEYRKKKREENKQQIKKYMKKYHDNSRDNLTDYYVMNNTELGKLDKQDITPEMIETKRLLIFIKRELKNNDNGKQC